MSAPAGGGAGGQSGGGVIAIVIALVAILVVVCTGLILGLAVLASSSGALAGGCAGDGGPGGGAQQVGPQAWSAEQMTNAQTIVSYAITHQLPQRAAVIALSAAIVESQIQNLSYGDRDSLGLFQQRPSAGWGTPAQLLNTGYATDAFYRILLQVPGWATMPPGAAAQAVQRSGFPERYGPQEAPAAALVARLWTGPDNPVPPDATTPAGPPAGPDAQLAALTTTLCPDQGGNNIPLSPDLVDPRKLPPGFIMPTDPTALAAVTYALAQLGKPYVWAAKGPDAYDCSGLMMAAWAAAGVGIPAGTVNQKNAGTATSLAAIAPGDLVFIPGSLGSPTNPRHVGMYVGSGLIVNAYDSSTGVVLQSLGSWQGDIVTIRHIAGAPAAAPDLLAAGAGTD